MQLDLHSSQTILLAANVDPAMLSIN